MTTIDQEYAAIALLRQLRGCAWSDLESHSGKSYSSIAKKGVRKDALFQLHAPIRVCTESRLVTLSPDTHLLDALRKLEEGDVRLGLVQESRDTILGVVSKSKLEDILCRSQSQSRTSRQSNSRRSALDTCNPTVTAIMSRNISIETSDATVLEVLERMTVGACPFVVIVNEHGYPMTLMDPIQVLSCLSLSRDMLKMVQQKSNRSVVINRKTAMG